MAILTLAGCDMKKNTWFNRKHQALNTKYNVYYNANESFKKGNKRIEEAFQPDYSHVIPVFAVSDASTKGAGTGDMNKAVEKCEQAIQKRSMQKKPKKDYSKMRDPNYVSFYNQEEFNSYMDEVYMLMGKSKYYANDYLAASATFTYVTKHFSHDQRLVTEANIWKARSMKEMDWIYEADEILKRIDPEEIDPSLSNLYNGAMADLLVTQREYKAALPYLEKAAETEKDRTQRTRFNFVAAQIYQLLGDKEKAFTLYEKVIKANPTYQMSFNAKIRETEVVGDKQSTESLVIRLQKMAKNKNNEDYLDQIYYAIGNIYLAKKDTAKAVENYLLSVEKSTRNGKEKAQTLITLGDLYYERPDYVLAQPCFSEASSLIDHKHDDYARVSRLASVLDELVQNYNTYKLQDSLLILSTASKGDLTAAINRQIAKIIEEEKKERERRQKEYEEQKQLELEIENMAVMDKRALGNAQESTWYFYVKSTVDKGKLEFRKKFGQRRLEDNWNRKNKTIAVFSEESLSDMVDMDALNMGNSDEASEESTDGANKQTMANEANPKRPEYYLKQIPFSDEQKKISNEQLADALFNLGVIYDEKLNDYEKAFQAFEEFARRYPNDPRTADGFYCCYRIAGKMNDIPLADKYRDRLLSEYPDSKYAKILSQPDFKEKLERMKDVQDSLYEKTYAAFLNGQFNDVKTNTAYMEANYPVSSLMPKFLLLNALSIGKTAGKDTFSSALNNLLERYPNSDVSSMAKDILALINQGNNPEQGKSAGGLMSLREENRKEIAEENGVVDNKGFTASFDSPYIFVIITDTTKVNSNKLLYETATYNFTKFLIKDFDLNVKDGILSVSGLDNYEEALWYINGVIADQGIQSLLSGTDYKYLLITPENLDLIGKGYTVEQYEKFYRENIAGKNKRSNKTNIELVGEKKELEEATTTQKLDVKEGDDLNGAKVTSTPSETPQTSAPATEVKEETKPSTETASEPKAAAPQPEEKSNAQPEEKKENTLPESSSEQKESDKTVQEQPKKELRKYKGLYTYDPSSSHCLAIIVNGKVNESDVTKALNEYNKNNHALLNLSVETTSSKDFSQIFVIGDMPSAEIGMSYLTQIVKSVEVKNAFGSTPYRNIVISKDNLKALKESGNINVYMELYKRLYLKR
ncbi:MAG: tetratricopeptide repeat protein [Paludibacteraceae bacterium]|nr:tetratricopeptide repeat protein [Paludibacteraceae bacterium]